MVGRAGNDHEPPARRLVPEDVGVAEIGHAEVEHGIAAIGNEAAAIIIAHGQMLRLMRSVEASGGEQRDHRIQAEAGAIFAIDHGAT